MAELAQYLADPLRECGELDFFDLDDGETTSFSYLEEEESVADVATNADHDLVWLQEDVVHEGLRSFNEAVLLTLSTIGAAFVKTIALTEQGEMTVR